MQEETIVRRPLQGKVAIVTGASRGIGRAIAQVLAQQGASILLTARSDAQLAGVAQEITASGGKAASLACDLREPDAAASVVAEAVRVSGHLDIVVSNAGATKRGAFLNLTDADFHDGFQLKFFGAVRLVRAAWPYLQARRGAVVFIAGIGGRTPGAEFTIGGSVNAALLSLTKALADQGIADGVQVNAINPGMIRTDRLTTRINTLAEAEQISPEDAAQRLVRDANVEKLGEPEDIAHLVAYLVSNPGRLLHGALIDADSGATKTI